jgi:hypothetical protein
MKIRRKPPFTPTRKKAARRLMELAHAVEPVQDGRITSKKSITRLSSELERHTSSDGCRKNNQRFRRSPTRLFPSAARPPGALPGT